MIRNMLIGLDGSPYAEAALDLGLRWARQSRAGLTGLAVVDEPTIRRGEPTGIGGSYYKVLRDEARLKDANQRVDWFLEQFSARCGEAGVAGQGLRKVGFPAEQILAETEDHDLLLLGQRTYFHFATQEYNDETLDVVLRNAHRPVVAVPMKKAGGGAVVLAYDATPPATRALEAFQQVGLFAGQTVHVVSVAHDEGDAIRRAEEATQFLRFHGFAAEARPLAPTRSVPKVLLEQVHRTRAGMLVMGAHGRSAFREAFFGSTTRTVLQQCETVVFLHH